MFFRDTVMFGRVGVGETLEQRDQIRSLLRQAKAQAGSGLRDAAISSFTAAEGVYRAAGSPSSLADEVSYAREIVFGTAAGPGAPSAIMDWEASQERLATIKGTVSEPMGIFDQLLVKGGSTISSIGALAAKSGLISKSNLQSGQDYDAYSKGPQKPEWLDGRTVAIGVGAAALLWWLSRR
jgi:hypothetical protein